jgi:mono/diheme cytochrome c family protein
VNRRRWAATAALALALTSVNLDADEWSAPADARARHNPVSASPDALAQGRALYQRHCVKCHGPKGRGDGPAARFGPEAAADLTAIEEILSDGEIFWKISTGRKVGPEIIMPGVSKAIPNEEDRWKLVHYVRTLLDQQP